jgi:hypothetical protein
MGTTSDSTPVMRPKSIAMPAMLIDRLSAAAVIEDRS